MMYHFYQAGNKIICVSSYAGRKVRGVSICSNEDSFDPMVGMKLAQLRCDNKIAAKRYHRARTKLNEAEEALRKAQEHYDRMISYYEDSYSELADVEDELNDYLENC